MNPKTGDRPTGRDVGEVTLPTNLLDRVDERLPRTNFDTRDQYIAYVLAETLARVEDASDDEHGSVDEREVESRLRSLGYLQ